MICNQGLIFCPIKTLKKLTHNRNAKLGIMTNCLLKNLIDISLYLIVSYKNFVDRNESDYFLCHNRTYNSYFHP